MAIPEWAKAMRLPNTEIKHIRNGYYLYEVHCKYNKETKERKKIKPIYLGKLVEGVGLVKKGEKINVPSKPTANVEYGLTATISELMKEEVSALKTVYPDQWKSILGMAYSRLVYQSPIKDMDQHYERSFLSAILGDTHMSADYISNVIRNIGKNRECVLAYFNKFKPNGDTLIFDGSDLPSASEKMTDVKMTKMKTGGYGTVLNIMMVFSLGLNKPLYYRLLRGNIKDVKSFILCLRECGITDLIVIMDKGFYSAKNINILDEMNVQYIIPLKRDCDLIDYSKASVDYLDEGGEAFRYHGREIYMYRKDIDDNHSIDLCVDCSMRSAETNDFQTRIHDNLNKRVEFQDERYTWKNFKEKRKTMGTIAFLTNNKLMMTKVDENRKPILDENGNEQKERASCQFVYKTYKRRNCIEEEIDIFKNYLDADRSYMQDKDAEEGWMFVNFVALQWYYNLLNKLDSTKLDSSYSVKTVIGLLKDVRKVKIGDKWYTDCLTIKERKAVQAFGIDLDSEISIP